jgi:hypothetical protein
MVHEKIFKIGEAKQVKVIVKGYPSSESRKVSTFFEILVKNGRQTTFYNPTGISLPVQTSLDKEDQKQIFDKVIAISGISEDHVKTVVSEFDAIVNSSVLW